MQLRRELLHRHRFGGHVREVSPIEALHYCTPPNQQRYFRKITARNPPLRFVRLTTAIYNYSRGSPVIGRWALINDGVLGNGHPNERYAEFLNLDDGKERS